MSELTSKLVHKSCFYLWDSEFQNFDLDGIPPIGVGSTHAPRTIVLSWTNGTSGVKNPFWKSQVKSGVNATTPFSWNVAYAEPSWFTVQWDKSWNDNQGRFAAFRKGTTSGYAAYEFFPTGALPDSGIVTRVTNRCIRKFISACNEATSSFEAGQDIGEYKETLNSIHRPLNSLSLKLNEYISALTKVRRSVRSGPKLKKVLADTYLEFRFGWLPLADDVGKLIADAQRYRFPVIPVRGSASENFAASVSDVNFSYSGYCPYGLVRSLHRNINYSLRYKGAIRSGSDASGRIGLAQSLQLLPENWLPTAWDLLPYSWIADYFTNVGDIITSLSFVNSRLVWAKKSSQTRETLTYGDVRAASGFGSPPPGDTLVSDNCWASGGAGVVEWTQGSRSALTSSDLMPRFEFRIPTSKYPYFNLAALLFSRSIPIIPFF